MDSKREFESKREPSPVISNRDDAVESATIAASQLFGEPTAEQLTALETRGVLETDKYKIEIHHVPEQETKYYSDSHVVNPEALQQERFATIYNKHDKRFYYAGIDGKSIPIIYETLKNPNPGGSGDLEFPLEGNKANIKAKVLDIVTQAIVSRHIGYAYRDFDTSQSKVFLTNEEYTGPLLTLSEKEIEAISLDEFIRLWQGLSGHYLSHVTRIGIRNITFAGFHTVGKGQYFDSALRVLSDSFLQSTMSAYTRGVSEYGDRFLQWLAQRGELEKENGKVLQTNQVHFAHDDVSWDLYGGEKGNVPFIVYPAEIILLLKTFSDYGFTRQKEKGRNDVSVSGDDPISDSDRNQIPLDLGLIFLPKSVQVDPETGSQYRLDKDLEPKEIEGNIKKLIMLVNRPEFNQIVERVRELKSPEELAKFFQEKPSDHPLSEFEPVFQWLGFDEEAMTHLIGDFLFDVWWKIEVNKGERISDGELSECIKDHLLKIGLLFQLAENTIAARDFWEEKFASGELKRPKRVIYYDGDPKEALESFMQENNVPIPYDGKPFAIKDRVIDIGVFAHTDQSPYLLRFASLLDLNRRQPHTI